MVTEEVDEGGGEASPEPVRDYGVCSTWGNFHYKTFDGKIFYFPGTCRYLFAKDCYNATTNFQVQIGRSEQNGYPIISDITVYISEFLLELKNASLSVNHSIVELPFIKPGLKVIKEDTSMRLTADWGLELLWDGYARLELHLPESFANRTCGLCGDFNGMTEYNEFISNGITRSAVEFGNLQKLESQPETCEDVSYSPDTSCYIIMRPHCERILTGLPFRECNSLVDVSEYLNACTEDLCICHETAKLVCACSSIAEYSKECIAAGGIPENWRTNETCSISCPFNMEYQECGYINEGTCSDIGRSNAMEKCESGCFCPAGTVLDNINGLGCIPPEECYCTLKGKTYPAGTTVTTPCQICVCRSRLWNCKNRPCPATCSVEGGSHITTFDESRYAFKGNCQYILSQLCSNSPFTVSVYLLPSSDGGNQTILAGVSLIVGKKVLHERKSVLYKLYIGYGDRVSVQEEFRAP
ncbi:mucin-2-like [Lissotriton helveticus]